MRVHDDDDDDDDDGSSQSRTFIPFIFSSLSFTFCHKTKLYFFVFISIFCISDSARGNVLIELAAYTVSVILRKVIQYSNSRCITTASRRFLCSRLSRIVLLQVFALPHTSKSINLCSELGAKSKLDSKKSNLQS